MWEVASWFYFSPSGYQWRFLLNPVMKFPLVWNWLITIWLSSSCSLILCKVSIKCVQSRNASACLYSLCWPQWSLTEGSCARSYFILAGTEGISCQITQLLVEVLKFCTWIMSELIVQSWNEKRKFILRAASIVLLPPPPPTPPLSLSLSLGEIITCLQPINICDKNFNYCKVTKCLQ
jgi:hypothetical protein